MKNLPLEKIESVYSGPKNVCMCGCAGTYSQSDRSKKIILGKMSRAAEGVGFIDTDHIAVETSNRIYAVYFKKVA